MFMVPLVLMILRNLKTAGFRTNQMNAMKWAPSRGAFSYRDNKNNNFTKEIWLNEKSKNMINKFVKEESGEGFLDAAMKILIVVVIGAAIILS